MPDSTPRRRGRQMETLRAPSAQADGLGRLAPQNGAGSLRSKHSWPSRSSTHRKKVLACISAPA